MAFFSPFLSLLCTFVFGCTRPQLWHTGSLVLMWDLVPDQDGIQAPCIGSVES